MGLMPESYSSVADVTAVTRHILDEAAGYSTTTRPTLLEVENFIDDTSALLNIAIAGAGFGTPITEANARRACDLWVRAKAVALVEASQESAGFDGEGSTNRADWFWAVFPAAQIWVEDQIGGWQKLGITQGTPVSDSLAFTGLNRHSERTDPTSAVLEQPKFRRAQWGGK